MAKVKQTFHNATEIKRIWEELTPDEACDCFDDADLSVDDVRKGAGEEAGNFYERWIYRQIL